MVKMGCLWIMMVVPLLHIGVNGRVYLEKPIGTCSSDLTVKIGEYSYSLNKAHEFSYVPSKLEFDAKDNLFAILEDNNNEYPSKAYIKSKNSNDFQLIPGLDDPIMALDLAYDHRSNKMYFATEDGIYVYALTLSLHYELASYTFKGLFILNINFDKNGKPYILTHTNNEIYTVEEGNEKKAFSKVTNATFFKIDNDGNFYFIVDDHFHVLWADGGVSRNILLVPDIGYKAIAFDGEGNGYLAYKEGLLFLKHGSKKFVKVTDLYGAVTSVAIDSKGNMVLGYRKKLFNFARIGKCYSEI